MIKLYVGNLPYSYNDDALKQLFSAYNPASATVIFDRMSGRSKGFGFVEVDDAMAPTAVAEVNGKDVEGRNLVVNEARPMAERPRRDVGGGGDRRGGCGGGDRRSGYSRGNY